MGTSITGGSIQRIIDHITATAAAPCNPIELKNQIEQDTVWIETTCLKANIHIPVDWILLRDAVRTLIKAVTLIRAQGLKHRMNSPESFMKAMNRLSIEMTHSGRKAGSKKQRKKVFRRMKDLVKPSVPMPEGSVTCLSKDGVKPIGHIPKPFKSLAGWTEFLNN